MQVTPNPQPGRCAGMGSAHPPKQARVAVPLAVHWLLLPWTTATTPSSEMLQVMPGITEVATTVPRCSAPAFPDKCHNSQLGDVTGNDGDQGGEISTTTVPNSSAAASPDNTLSDAWEQRLRPRSTMEVPWPQLQLGPNHTNPRPSSGITPTKRENNLHDPNHKWVKNLSSAPLTQAQKSQLVKGPNYAIALRNPPHLVYITASQCVQN